MKLHLTVVRPLFYPFFTHLFHEFRVIFYSFIVKPDLYAYFRPIYSLRIFSFTIREDAKREKYPLLSKNRAIHHKNSAVPLPLNDFITFFFNTKWIYVCKDEFQEYKIIVHKISQKLFLFKEKFIGTIF